jgi:4-hydroxybenzoate polyprenyltransferase
VPDSMNVISSQLGEPENGDSVYESLCRERRPLVIDVDEVLQHSHLFADAVFSEIIHGYRAIFSLLAAALRGKSGLRQWITESTHFDPSRLLFNEEVITFLLHAMGEGRSVFLSSEKYPECLVRAVAQHIGVFTAWSATHSDDQPSSQATGLPQRLSLGFDYLGRETVELPHLASRVSRPASRVKSSKVDGWTWASLLRIHQYSKNALVLVPLLTAHQFALQSAAQAIFAAIAFSLCASGAYILNDLIDVKADRLHPKKCNRPIASGAILPTHAALAMAATLAGALAIASLISLPFLGVLLGYLALTTAYSFYLKKVAVADVVTLAILYTIRVIAGAVAISVTMSEWLFAFSLFMFMSLALVKRHVELARQSDGGRLAARDYRADDKSMVAILAAATGFNAVVIFTLYISSETVRALYTHPQLLWINCPILMYWIARVMLLAQRGQIDDDPVIFALSDRVSWLALGTICSIMLVAI